MKYRKDQDLLLLLEPSDPSDTQFEEKIEQYYNEVNEFESRIQIIFDNSRYVHNEIEYYGMSTFFEKAGSFLSLYSKITSPIISMLFMYWFKNYIFDIYINKADGGDSKNSELPVELLRKDGETEGERGSRIVKIRGFIKDVFRMENYIKVYSLVMR